MAEGNNANLESSPEVTAKEKHDEYCRELNMDKDTQETSWKNYVATTKRHVLEGDQSLWLCCSIYSACRRSQIPTVGGESNALILGNCVSLINLLRVSGVSIYDFFQSMKIWVDYNNLNSLKDHIRRLEDQFNVTYHLYNLYKNTYDKIFKMSPNEKKNKKSRPGKCTASKLYDLCWKLFLCVKNEDLENSKDLLTSMYLLFSCIDLIFRNAIADHRTDIVDPNFSGVPKGFTSSSGAKDRDIKCIISNLCQMHENIDLNEFVRSSSFITIIQELFKSRTLFGDSTTFMKIISNDNFEPNYKALNNAYEQYVLSSGGFDETIFLKNPSRTNNNEYGVTNTPLTRRDQLPSRDDGEPLVTSARKLQDVMIEWKEPSEFLRPILTDRFHELITTLMNTFTEKFPEGARRADVIKSLCYCFLHKILQKEIPKRVSLDLKMFTENEKFMKSLFACCTQMVLDSYFINTHVFPWVLGCFNISAFDFCKLIEPIVIEKDGILSREMIKKLNTNEEKCLQQLVWAGTSPLWELIAKEPSIPTYNSVDPKTLSNGDTLLSPVNIPYDSTQRLDYRGRDLFNVGRAERMEGPQIQQVSQGQQNNVTNSNEVSSTTTNTPRKKRAGSFALFFRKFYKLAYTRIKVFCDDLGIQNCIDVIWTIFENSVVDHTELIRNRHLDQIIMCAIYSYIKVCEMDTKFADIMVTYRKQPQSHSDIYRHVLIREEDQVDGRIVPAEYDSIIKYYNDVYVKDMCTFIMRFGPNRQLQMLSPHPTIQCHNFVRVQPNVVVTKLDRKDIPQSPDKFMVEINQNISNPIAQMNRLIKKNGKRNIPLIDESYITTTTTDNCSPKKISKGTTHCDNKVYTMLKDRSTQKLLN